MRYNKEFKTKLPMTHDSSTLIPSGEFKLNVMSTPRKSTVNFIRQFARTYATLPGTAFSTMNAN